MSAVPVLVAAAVVLAVGWVAYRELAAWLVAQRAVRLRAQAKPIVDRRIEHLDGQLELGELAAILALDLASRETAALVVAPGGRPLAAIPGEDGTPPAAPLDAARYAPAFAGNPHATYRTRGPHGERLLHALIPPRDWLPEPPAVVQLVADLGPERALLRRLTALLGATLALTAAVAAALALTVGGAWPLLALPLAGAAPLLARPLLRAAHDEPGAQALAPPPQTPPPPGLSRDEFTAAMRRVEAAFLARQASEQRMRRFVADASHELRTPLTAVGGAADVLLRGAAAEPEQVERLAHLIRARADVMGRLVDDLMTLARLDAGAALRTETVDLGRLVCEHAEELRLQTPGRTIAADAPDGVHARGDPDRLRQVLANLTANALRHAGDSAAVSIATRQDGDQAVLTVRDDGPGIDPADHARLFERFYRSAAAREVDGSGLGLAIVAEIAAAHGGTVSVRSTPGAGATFEVRLPSANRQE